MPSAFTIPCVIQPDGPCQSLVLGLQTASATTPQPSQRKRITVRY